MTDTCDKLAKYIKLIGLFRPCVLLGVLVLACTWGYGPTLTWGPGPVPYLGSWSCHLLGVLVLSRAWGPGPVTYLGSWSCHLLGVLVLSRTWGPGPVTYLGSWSRWLSRKNRDESGWPS